MHGIGVIGCGVWGCHSLERRLEEQPGVRIVSVTAGNEWGAHAFDGDAVDHGRHYAEELGAEYVADWREVVEDPRVTIISLMTSPATRREPACAAFAAGKHVVVDKPLAANMTDAEAIYRAEQVSTATGFMLCGYHTRPAVEELRRLIHCDRIGPVKTLSIRLFFTGGIYPGFQPTRRWISGTAGGELTTVGTHALMTARFLSTAEPISLSARTQNLFYPEYEAVGAEDRAELNLNLVDGSVVSITCGRLPSRTGGEMFTVEVVGTRGVAHIEGNVLTVIEDGSPAQVHDFSPTSTPDQVMKNTFARFMNAVEGSDEDLPTSFEDGLAIQRILHTAYESARTGCVLPFPGAQEGDI